MVFSSMIFLCGFLPLVLLFYFICPKKFQNLFLFAASLFFYAWGEPVYVFIMLFSTVFDYVNGRLIEGFRVKEKKGAATAVLVVSLVGNLGILGFFKYTDFVIGTINQLSGSGIQCLKLALPIGISFYTFQTLSYTIDVYRGQVKAQHNIISFGMYVALFPQLIAGPIVRYSDVEKQVTSRKTTFDGCAAGMQRFLIGLGKKVLLANQIGALWSQIQGMEQSEMSVLMAWLSAIAYTFQIYFDFSGYSDMAIGLGQIFGFTFPENFRYPYESKSITEFWRRWHMTLSGWFREYLYIPLGGNRKGMKRQIFNLFLVWFLTGLWHGAGWNFICWGLYYFVFLLLEKTFLLGWMEKWPAVCRNFYTMIVVVIGWVLFSHTTMTELKQQLKAMVGIGVPFVNELAVYEWTSYGIFLVLLAVGSTQIPKRFGEKVKVRAGDGVAAVYTLILLLCSISFLISGSYNPFLYFRF